MQKILLFIFMVLPLFSYSQEKNAVELFFKNAEKFRQAKEYYRAIVEYEQAIAIADTTAKVHYWKGVCNLLVKDTAKAIEDWDRTLIIDKKYMPAYSAISKVYETRDDYANYKRNIDFWLSVEQDPVKQINLCYETATYFFREARYEDAHVYTKAGMGLSSSNVEMLFLDAQISNKIKKYREAIATIDLILVQLPQNSPLNQLAKYNYEKGIAYYGLEEYEKAMPILEKANLGPFKSRVTKLKPDYFFAVASAFEDIYAFDQAKSLLNRAMKIDKTYIKANILMADIIVKEEHHHKGIHLFELGLEGYKGKDKTFLKAYNEFIDILLSSQKYEKALTYSNNCLANFRGARDIMFYKVVALHKLGRREEAIAVGLDLLSDSNITPKEYVKCSLLMSYVYGVEDLQKCKQSLLDCRKGPYYPVGTYALEYFDRISGDRNDM
ncbi:tetratricopeptide repeat protein [Flammeovirga kamogawensis]|uniref:Tetratricopeptide repeat protein n=1 Tax=Flammeovirga kamogawensis TaxID=373891 RepID=A0ABX8GYK7_9BACT|nr:tetratricopeptide repeat protein [Flammeovirga kamogawensis]MBB6458914.1 tetratricopeptide (TPR) repeat protein [Flammeovirga kamogawensis]QWG08493.1 tetratricopeptide repeat protein [Flammeovirga kamogawensis]TRX66788.1 tetratricopeptide repeat protein [Flammeovirga kamogawensis]